MYDGIADFPTYPINFLADMNALAGFWYAHGTYLDPFGDDASTQTPYGYTPDEVGDAVAGATANCDTSTHCQRHGDTIYITLPARTLPIMQPFLDFGAATGTSSIIIPIVDLVSPLMQTLIETGYDRADYGHPTPAKLIPQVDLLKLVRDLLNDIPEGINAALEPGLNPLSGSIGQSGATTTVTASTNDKSSMAAEPIAGVPEAPEVQSQISNLESSVSDEATGSLPVSGEKPEVAERIADDPEVAERIADGPETANTESQVSNSASPVSERKALKRPSPIAKPGEGLTVPESSPTRSVVRRPIDSDLDAKLPQPVKDTVNAFTNIEKTLSSPTEDQNSAADAPAKTKTSDTE